MTIDTIGNHNHQQAAEIMRSAFNHVGQDWTTESSYQYIQETLDWQLHILGLELGTPVAIACGQHKTGALYLDIIGVHPDHMGKGYAKQMWNYLEDYALQHNLSSIKLVADPKSLAYQWYLRLGLTDTGWVEMEKPLTK